MKTPIVVLGFLLLLVACGGRGVTNLGSNSLMDGKHIVVTQAKTTGFSGPDVTVLWAYLCDDDTGICTFLGDYSATAPGLVETMAAGTLSALIQAGGYIGAAATLRPTRIDISGGGASAQVDAKAIK